MTAIVLGLAGCVVLAGALGYALYSALSGPSPRPATEVAGTSLALGAGAAGLGSFWISLAGWPVSRETLCVLGLLALGALAAFWWRGRLARIVLPEGFRPADGLLAPPLVLCAAGATAVCIVAAAFPFLDWDSYLIWGLKGKIFAAESLAEPTSVTEPNLRYCQPGYPQLFPFMLAAVRAATGSAEDAWIALAAPFFYVAAGLLMYGLVRARISRLRAVLLVSAFMIAPSYVRWAATNNAEAAFVLMYAASIGFLVRWLEGGARGDLGLAIAFTVLLTHTKNEGLPLAVLNLVAALSVALRPAGRARLKGCAVLAIAWAAFCLPWWLWSRGVPTSYQDFPSRLGSEVILENLARLGVVGGRYLEDAVQWKSVGGLGVLLPLAAAAGFRAFRKPVVQALWLLYLGQLAVYALVYLIYPGPLEVVMPMIHERMILHTLPAVVLLVAMHWKAAAPNETGTVTVPASGRSE